MLLLVIVVILVICLLAAFVKSALLLLPWTITAAVLAGLFGMGLGMLAKSPRATGTTISVLSSFGLTFGFGYLGYWFIRPVAPPQKHGWEALLEQPNPPWNHSHIEAIFKMLNMRTVAYGSTP